MHCHFKHNGYVAFSVRNSVRSASKRMCNRKWEVRVGPETQGCPTCFCLSLQREREREWLKVCQVWTEWETGSRYEEFCPNKHQSSPAAEISMVTGMFSLIIAKAEHWVYLHIAILTDGCQIHVPQTHTCSIPHVTVTEETCDHQRQSLSFPQKAFRVQEKNVWEYNSAPQCLANNIFHVLWAEMTGTMFDKQISCMFWLNVNGRDCEVLSLQQICEPKGEKFRSVSLC